MTNIVRHRKAGAVPGDICFLVFDWDGTLMDSEAQIVSCLHAAVCDLSLPPMDNETLKNVIGLGLREAIDTLVPGRDTAFHQAFVEHYRRHWFASQESQLFAGVREVLEVCRQHRLQLGIATGKARRGLDRVLGDTGLGDMFDATRCADEAPSKPHPQMLFDMMQRLDVRPEQTIMVGDTEYDMEMATNAGAGKIAITAGVHSRERLERHSPLASLARISELPAWLRDAGILSS
jgi:phosphoglycolate phosphatase